MMNFSAWDWSDTFRLQDAACLIAGVMPISKRNPTSEEMPPQARPIFIKLTAAYIEWLLQGQNPERPKSQVLEGYKEEDGNVPPFPSMQTAGAEIVSRQAIHRFLSETGRKSVYDFQPRPVEAIGATRPEPVLSLPADTESAPVMTSWTLTKPKRFQGYTEPLYLLLETAHIAGRDRCTAREVLQGWARNQPSQIAKVIEGDSLDYYLAKGGTKTANLKAISAAIFGMTGKS